MILSQAHSHDCCGLIMMHILAILVAAMVAVVAMVRRVVLVLSILQDRWQEDKNNTITHVWMRAAEVNLNPRIQAIQTF